MSQSRSAMVRRRGTPRAIRQKLAMTSTIEISAIAIVCLAAGSQSAFIHACPGSITCRLTIAELSIKYDAISAARGLRAPCQRAADVLPPALREWCWSCRGSLLMVNVSIGER
jgi:hypothetical protein